MVLDGIASSLLNRLLGDFVTGFDSANVKFSLSGELTLHNLQLKSSALDKLGLPIRVSAGCISKLHLRVPWRNLGSQPAVVSIEGLYVLASPASRSKDQYNEQEAEKAEQDAKQRKLALAESYKLARRQTPDTQSNNDGGFFSRLLNSVLSTLQLKIVNLHFRLEDPGIPDTTTTSDFHSPPFAAGFSVASLTGLSTDSQWNESTTSGSIFEMLLYKLLDLKTTSAYLDLNDASVFSASKRDKSDPMVTGTSKPEVTKSSDNLSLSRLQDHMMETMSRRCDGKAHAYVMEPTEAVFKVVLNRNPANFDFAQFELSSVFQAVSLVLQPSQLRSGIFLAKRLEYFAVASRYLKWRPAETPIQNPRGWWKFVIDAVVHDVRKRRAPWLPEAITLRRKQRKAYMALYTRVLDSQNAKQLSTTEKDELADLERVLTFDDIMFFRALSEIRLQNEKSQKESQATTTAPQAGWGSWLGSFVWNGAPTATTPSNASTNLDGFWESVHLSEEEQSQLLDAIHFDPTPSQSNKSRLAPPESYIRYKIHWQQEVGQLRLDDDSGAKLVNFAFFNLNTQLHSKDTQNAIETTLESIILTDCTSKTTQFPRIVYPHNLLPNEPLLRFKLALNSKPNGTHPTSGASGTPEVNGQKTPSKVLQSSLPSTSPQSLSTSPVTPADWSMDFFLHKLNIIWNTKLALKVLELFYRPIASGASTASQGSSSATTGPKYGTKESKREEDSAWISWTRTKHRNERLLALSKLKPSSNIRIHLEAPNLLIPENCDASNSPILVMELGTFNMETAMSKHRDGVSSPSGPSPATSSSSIDAIAGLTTPEREKSSSEPLVLSSPMQSSIPVHKSVDVSEYYDIYSFSVANIRAYITRTEKIAAQFGLALSPSQGTAPPNVPVLSKYAHVINPFGFNFSLATCKINVESMPNVKLKASLPQLRLTLSSPKLLILKALIASIAEKLSSIHTMKPNSTGNVQNASIAASAGLQEPLTRPISNFVDDWSYTQSLASKTDLPEEEMVTVGLALSIELDAPEIEVTLVHKPEITSGKQNDQGESESDYHSTCQKPKELVRLKLVNLGYRLESYPKMIQSTTFLKALSIQDFMQADLPRFQYLVNSEMSENLRLDDYLDPMATSMGASPLERSLIHITYIYRHPETASSDELQNHCKVRFNTLQVNLALGTIWAVYNYVYQLTSSAKSASPSKLPDLPKLEDTSTQNLDSSSSASQSTNHPSAPPHTHNPSGNKSHLKFLLEVEFQAIMINFIEDNSHPLAELSLTRSSATLKIIEHQGYQLHVKLGNMTVLDTLEYEEISSSQLSSDPLVRSSRRHVISVRGPHVIEFSLTNIPPSTEKDDAFRKTHLDLTIHSIRVLVNPKWVFTMILNVGELIYIFTAPRQVMPAKNATAPLKPIPIDYLADPAFFNYHIKIMRPYIILPQDQTSSAMLITDWGEIEIRNSFQEVPYVPVADDGSRFAISGCRKFKEKISVSLKKATISSGQLCTQSEDLTPTSEMVNMRLILGETNITISVSNTFIAHTMIPRREHMLDVHLGEVKIFLSPEQVTFLLLVAQNSLIYQPTEAEIRRKLQAALFLEAMELSKQENGETRQNPSTVEVGSIRFHLECITVEAHDHYQLFPSNDRRFISVVPQNVPKLLNMDVVNSKVAWTNFSDGSMRLSFQIASIAINDIRPRSMRANIASSSHKAPVSPRDGTGAPVLLPASHDSKKSQLVGSCVTVPSKGQFSVSLTMHDMQLLPEASFIQQVWANTAPLLFSDLLSLLAHRERIMVSTLTPRQEKKWRDQRFHPEAGSSYVITLNRPQIVLSMEENSGVSSWLKFANLTSSSCEISMKFMSSLQSYDVKLNQLSVSAGESFDTSMISLFQTSQTLPFLNPAVTMSPLLDHSIYHYNLLSPVSIAVRAILLPDAQDFQLEFQDQAKISLSYNDYNNILAMIVPYSQDHRRKTSTEKGNGSLQGSQPSGLSSSSSKPKTKLKLKIKESTIGNIPSISDEVGYRLVKTEAKFQSTAATGPNATRGSTVDPKRATEYWANLDLERKRATIQVPDLTLGTAATATATASTPSISGPVSIIPHTSVVGNAVKEVLNELVEEKIPIESIVPFVHKKLMVFNCKVQVMVMDNREYDLGLLRTEIMAEECWIQDWDIDAYVASLPSDHLEALSSHSSSDRLAIPHKKAAIRATLSADSFNIKAATWEPLLDPFFLDIGLTDKSLVVKSEVPLNLTISETFLSSYKRFRNALENRGDQSPSASSLAPSPASNSPHISASHLTGNEAVDSPKMTATRNRIQAPYYVKNETGLPMKYRLFAEDASLPPAEERLLAPGAEEPVMIPPKWAKQLAEASAARPSSSTSPSPHVTNKHHLDRSAQSWASKHLSMTAQVDFFLAATNLALDHIGTQVAHVGHNRMLVIDIQFRLGAKLITFKSRVSIHNNTSVPLVVGKEVPVIANTHLSSTSLRKTPKDDSFVTSTPHVMDYEAPRTSLDSARPKFRATSSLSSLHSDHSSSNTASSDSDAPSGRASLDGPRNASSKPVGDRNMMAVRAIATIEPFDVFCLPLDCMLDTVLRFRPGDHSSTPSSSRIHTGAIDETQVALQSGKTNLTDLDDMKFSWSPMRCDVKNLKAMEPIFVDCFPKQLHRHQPSASFAEPHNFAPDLSSTFQYSVGVSKLANKSAILAGADLLVMHFQPPLVLENLLPSSITFSMEPQAPKSLKQPDTAFLPKVGKLKKGQRIPIHQMPSQCAITFRMVVNGFEWSPYVLIRDPEISGQESLLRSASRASTGGQTPNNSGNSKIPKNTDSQRLHPYIDLTDKFGKSLRIQIENKVNEVGTRTVTFYAKFWIVNKIGLPLVARAHSSNLASIGAGMLGLYAPSSSANSSSSVSSADMIDERNGLGVYGGGDLRDLFMADLSAGCLLNMSPSPAHGSGNTENENLGRQNASSVKPSLNPLPIGGGIMSPKGTTVGSPRTIALDSLHSSPPEPASPRAPTASATSGPSSRVPSTAKPMMYCPSGFDNNRFHIKVAESRWSDAIVLNTQNDSTVLSVQETEDAARHKRKYEVALVIKPAANQFWRTRVVSLAPRYMLINKTPHSLFLRQVNSSYVCSLLPGEHAPLHWMDANNGQEKIRLKLNLPKCTWSGPIDPTQLEIFSLKLFNAETGLRYLIRVMVRLHPETSITTITIKEEDLNAPLFRIDNYTKATLMVRQLNVQYATEAIPPLSRRVWGWLEPAYQSHRVQVLFNTQDKVGLSFSLAKVKVYPPIQFQTSDGKLVWLLAETSTDRTTRVLTIRPILDPQITRNFRRRSSATPGNSNAPHSTTKGADLHSSSQKGRSITHSPPSIASPLSSPSPTLFDSNYDDEEELKESLRLHVSLFKVAVSVINSEPMELIYGSLSGIDVTYVNYSLKWSLDVRVGDIQIDNQIPSTFFPVAVFSLGDAPRDWLRFSMIRSYEYADIIYQPFVSLLLRATTVRMDETLLLKLLDLTGVTIASFNASGKTALLTSNVDVLSLGDDEDSSKMIYNHVYLLNPVALSISYMTSSSTREAYWKQADREKILSASYSYTNTGLDRKQTNAILGVPDKFIPNVESAPLNLNALLLKHSFASSDQLVDRILQHYKSQLMRQMYAILGSFEALGNPISLVSNLGIGVKDLFYEPAKGIAISPEEFGAGLKRGGASFVSKSIGGLFNSTSQVLRAVGSGMAFISMDDDYQAKRDLAKRRDQPRNALTGVATGLKEFGEGLVEGVAGIFVQPIRGFQQEGALGMVKGVGKGLVGVAVKPVVGTLDLVQRTSEGISNTASANVLLRRARYPRYLSEDGVIRPFDAKESLPMHMLHSIENSAFAHEDYWGYLLLSQSKPQHPRQELLGWILIASAHRITLVSRVRPTEPSSQRASPSSPSSLGASTATPPSSRSPPSVKTHWILTYPSITDVEKFHENSGSLKIKLSSRNEDSTLITHTLTCLDVTHLMQIEAFIVDHMKKWQAYTTYVNSLPSQYQAKSQR